MRLLDELLQDKTVDPGYKKSLDGLVVVSGDNVAQYYWEGTDQETWYLTDFPCVVPPFPDFYLDFHAPTQIVSRDFGTIPWPEALGSQWGFAVSGGELTQENREAFLSAPAWQQDRPHFEHLIQDHRWFLDMWLDLKAGGVLYPAYCQYRVLITEEGRIGFDEGLQKPHVAMRSGPQGYTNALKGGALLGLPLDQADNFFMQRLSPLLHTALLTISFLHCRNVTAENVTPPAKRIHTKAQKRRGEQSYQPVPYKVLNIRPMQEILKRTSQEQGVGTVKALHICRGSFATYTEEGKLFGKYTGRFWRPMHVKGSKTQGVATKDYNIVLPEE